MEENGRRNYFMINLHDSMGPDRDRNRDPWICSKLRTCLPAYVNWAKPYELLIDIHSEDGQTNRQQTDRHTETGLR